MRYRRDQNGRSANLKGGRQRGDDIVELLQRGASLQRSVRRGDPVPRGTGLLPGREEKRFQSHDYYGAAERRRQELLARVSNRVRG